MSLHAAGPQAAGEATSESSSADDSSWGPGENAPASEARTAPGSRNPQLPPNGRLHSGSPWLAAAARQPAAQPAANQTAAHQAACSEKPPIQFQLRRWLLTCDGCGQVSVLFVCSDGVLICSNTMWKSHHWELHGKQLVSCPMSLLWCQWNRTRPRAQCRASVAAARRQSCGRTIGST